MLNLSRVWLTPKDAARPTDERFKIYSGEKVADANIGKRKDSYGEKGFNNRY